MRHCWTAGELEETEAYCRQAIIAWQELGQHELAAKRLGAAGMARTRKKMLSKAQNEIGELVQALEQLMEAMGDRTG